MSRGRKKDPETLKLHGSRWADRRRRKRPRAAAGISKPPAWMDREAKAAWRRIRRQLTIMHLDHLADREALAGLCVRWSNFHQLTKALRALEVGSPEHARTLAGQAAAYRDYMRGCRDFGLTPGSRDRLTAPPEPVQLDLLDELTAS